MADPRAYPDRPLIGVGVVVRRGGRVLLVRRRRPPRAGEWSLPGGAQRLGERIFETAVREVAEEAGLTIAPRGILDVVDLIARDEGGAVQYHYTLIEVVADWAGGEARAGDDAAAVAWAAPEELERFSLWVETRRIIAKALAAP